MRNRDQSLVAVVYYHASYLFIYNFSYVVKMSDHDSVLITVFWWCLRAINDFLLSVSYFGFHSLWLRPYWITLTGPIYQNYNLHDHVNEYGQFLKLLTKKKYQ